MFRLRFQYARPHGLLIPELIPTSQMPAEAVAWNPKVLPQISTG